jgi:hypothetical protein
MPNDKLFVIAVVCDTRKDGWRAAIARHVRAKVDALEERPEPNWKLHPIKADVPVQLDVKQSKYGFVSKDVKQEVKRTISTTEKVFSRWVDLVGRMKDA